MKTSLQELIEYIEEWQPKNKFTDPIWHKAKSLLETEKQQIIDANVNGTQEAFIIAFKSISGRDLIFSDQDLADQKQEAENYYTSTFETNKETLK